MKPTNRKTLKKTPWIYGLPLRSRPGWYLCRYVGRLTRDQTIGMWWDGCDWYWEPNGFLQPDPDFFRGLAR